MRRRGFTLIELMVSMVIMLILLYIGLSSFSYINAFARYISVNQNIQENIDTFLSQLKKELMQASTLDDGTGFSGVDFPQYNPNSDSKRDLSDIVTPYPLDPVHDYYSFLPNASPILRFYILDSSGVKHRITYTLGVPTSNGNYAGIPKNYWLSRIYEPCEVLYSNEIWDGTKWSGITSQPITEQVITNFAVIRPSYSPKVFQIIVEAFLKDPTSREGKRFIRMIQVTLKQ
ncbi:MAG: PilW family protein [Caldisericum exile]